MAVPDTSSNRRWVEDEFAGVSLGDRRRDARLLEAATAMADQPTASNPQRLDWNELRAFYRLVHARRSTLEILQSGHRERTRARMTATAQRVLIVHDTTELDFTDHPAVHDELGPIGTGAGVGLLQHNSLAFDPESKQILGLVHQQLERRQPRPPRETRHERALRPHKESRLWLAGFRGVGRAPLGSRWIDVCDRGADYFEAMQQARQLGHEFLLRVRQDRRVLVPAVDAATGVVADELQTLHQAIAAIPAATTKAVRVASKGGRPGRTATVQVGYAMVRLQPPQPHGPRRGLVSLPVTLIRAWEAGVTEARTAAQQAKTHAGQAAAALQAAAAQAAATVGAAAQAQALAEVARRQRLWDEAQAAATAQAAQVNEYLDWWLATSSPIASIDDAVRAVSDYEWRWPVAEEYHKVEKSGLRIEGQRFETAAALMAALALVAVVAVRLLQLRYAREEQPEAAAGAVATAEEIALVGKATHFQGTTMTVKQFVDRVARLGGHLGRKCDGPPGWMSLWRGYQRLTDMLLGQYLAQRATEVKPTHDDPD
jgi:transposase-like protein